MAATATLMSDFLKEVGVRHTAAYTDRRFSEMSFKSLFGLSKLLLEYGVDNEALRLAEKSEIGKLPVPFLAGTDGGFVIVTSVGADRIRLSDPGAWLRPCRRMNSRKPGAEWCCWPIPMKVG